MRAVRPARKRPPSRRSFRVGPLSVMAGLLLASALLRLGDGSTIAMATELLRGAQAHATEAQDSPDAVSELLEALKQREADLDARDEALSAESVKLDEVREALSAQLGEVETAEAELRELLQLADTAAEDDLARLAAVYENMKPAEAAALFQQMPPSFAAGFLGLMPPPASAAILANMPPDAAYAVSVMLAGRHADLPKE